MAPNEVCSVEHELRCDVPLTQSVYHDEFMEVEEDSIHLDCDFYTSYSCDEYPSYSCDEYHYLYLQKHGTEFMMPIIFEDGMDFIECELYYASTKSQLSGGALRRLQSQQQRRSSVQELEATFVDALPSCIRRSKRTKQNVKDQMQTPRRRCSFGGLPESGDMEPALIRSNSMRIDFRVDETRVSFEEYVQVVTIHPVNEYPPDVRSKMWMSREEMTDSMTRAMAEDVRDRHRAQQKLEKAMQAYLKRKVQQQGSINSTIAECIQAA
jgi:hypothetical protein